MPNNNVETRIVENLRGIKGVTPKIDVDLERSLEGATRRVRRDVSLAVDEIIEEAGLDVVPNETFPELRIYVSVRIFRAHATGKVVFGYRVEISLRENVALRFGRPDPEEALSVETWRHPAEFKLISYEKAADKTTTQTLDEVIQQVRAFVHDWRKANPGVAQSSSQDRDNLQALIDGVGPVFEQLLNASGIRNLQELAQLTDEEISFLATHFMIQDDDGNPVGTSGEDRLKDFRAKARVLLAA